MLKSAIPKSIPKLNHVGGNVPSYKVISTYFLPGSFFSKLDTSISEFENDVTEHIKNGFIPLGGPKCATSNLTNVFLAQALVKYLPDDHS